ncbi:hypothetical protein ACFWXO_31975 [Kitasatospora sp. NPDC059088]|uniref:GP88 family protein n=1 Tax=Kitasatospora sp. NPDC059088 TaxID=3346722 RepID=UPI00369AC7E4
MEALTLFDIPAKPRAFLLSGGNSDLARDGIFTWTLPAWVVQRADGSWFNTCPEASVCAAMCFAYAPGSSYKRFPDVAANHLGNLQMVQEMPELWEQWMVEELRDRRYRGGAAVRVHDSGDFFSTEYTEAWWRIAESAPHVRFYAYTKAVSRVKDVAARLGTPANLFYRFSRGGTEDYLILPTDPQADVFADLAALEEAGYVDQAASDLIAAGPDIRVGMVANRMPVLRKRQGQLSFGELQLLRYDKLMPKAYRWHLARLAVLLAANAWLLPLLDRTAGSWETLIPFAAGPEESPIIPGKGVSTPT